MSNSNPLRSFISEDWLQRTNGSLLVGRYQDDTDAMSDFGASSNDH
jgi:hypothetical protein